MNVERELKEKYGIGKCRNCLRVSFCKSTGNNGGTTVVGCSGMFADTVERLNQVQFERKQLRDTNDVLVGNVENIYKGETKNGKDFWIITVDKVKLSTWKEPTVVLGDEVVVEYRVSGNYNNIQKINKR